MLLKRQLQNSAMLYHSEVICCELVVVKTRLNCHESARMSAVAAIGSIVDRRTAATCEPVRALFEHVTTDLCPIKRSMQS